MPHRLRGSLERLTDDENRSLRPIGMSVREAAARTGVLLDRLADTPGVRLVAAGVLVAAGAPRIGFAVISASHLLLVESVAWPAGAYTVTPQGFVLCDGVYIGQSVHTLAGSVRTLRRVAGRRVVGAVVVVHPSGPGTPSLPVGPAWIRPADVPAQIARRLLLRHRRNTYCLSDSNSWYCRTQR
ncbi:hypothetical protein [Paractinoplanes durhamensis]|uniref:Uncharacterized protein n=1 Tax=Paractinoplanes durhamensis TaxID=113563 RepID=A0ABQ3ZB29_9ACTN|nr:hypothetical protein [Actinoplanes durhamensis]GIE07035.1 hypothetical protein Adu01nite_83850 [Actinoplanes durhamensis]